MRRAGWLAIISTILLMVATVSTGVAGTAGSAAGDQVALVLDFNRLQRVVHDEGLDLADQVKRLRAAGVDGFVIKDRTLAQLEDLGLAALSWGWEFADRTRLTGGAGAGTASVSLQNPQRVYIDVPDPELRAWVLKALNDRWTLGAIREVRLSGVDWIEVVAPLPPQLAPADQKPVPKYGDAYSGRYPRALMTLPLGIWPGDVDLVAALGMPALLEVSAWPGAERHPETLLPPAVALPPGGVLMFSEGDVPAGAAPVLASAVRERGWLLGLRWREASTGLRSLAALLPERLVKVHPMWPGEPIPQIIDGIQERRERIVYFERFVSLAPGREAAADPALLAEVQAAIEGAGWRSSSAAVAPLPVSRIGGLSLPAAVRHLPAWALVAGLPLLSIGLALRIANRMTTMAGPVLAGIAGAVAAMAVTIAGGLVVRILLIDALHTAAVIRLPAAGLALALPSLWLLVTLVRAQAAADGGSLLMSPIRWGAVAAIAAVLFSLGLVWLRSGVDPVLPVFGAEAMLNSWLRAWLGVRLSLKELLLGHPLLVAAAVWAAATGGRDGLWRWLLPLAALGQASAISAFADLQMPLGIGLLRVVHSFWIGAALGVLLFVVARAVVVSIAVEEGQGSGGRHAVDQGIA